MASVCMCVRIGAILANCLAFVCFGVDFGSKTTDFRKLIEAEVNKVKGSPRVSEDSQQLIRQFKLAVWVCPTMIFVDDCWENYIELRAAIFFICIW